MKANSETNLKKKYDSVEEIREHKKELLEKFEGELPSYLSEYFDEQELRQIKREYYEKNVKDKNWDDIAEYWKKTEEEFWKNNKTRIVKRPKKVGHHLKPVYKEPHRATERVEQERELTEQERLALRALCEKDLYLFAVRYFPHYLKKPSSKFHKYLYKTLKYEINNKKRRRGLKLAIAAPRSNSKSSIISGIFPIWCICYQKKRFIIMISDTAGQAQDFLADIKRELEFNDKLIADFPHVCGKGPTWRLDEIVTKNGVKVLALGTGSKIRGRKFGVYRPSLVICDDLESGDMIRSPTTREFIRYQWFDKDLMFAGGEEGTSTDFIVVGTILGKDSLLHALTDPSQYPEWTSVRFSAVEQFSDSPLWDEWVALYKNKFDDKRKETAYKFFLDHKDEMLKGTCVLWPEGDPYYDLMIWKYMSPSAFYAEKQNDPYDPTKILVTRDQLHFEDFRRNEKIQGILKNARYFGALDPSLGRKGGDYSCICTLARDPKTGFIFVVDFFLKRASVDDQINAILALHQKYKYMRFAVEVNAFQLVVADALRKKSRELGFYVPIQEIKNYSDKKMRFEGIIPHLTDGTIVFDLNKERQSQQYSMAIEQITTYTGEESGKFSHDDAIDGLVMSFEIAKKPKFRRLYRLTKEI